MTWSTPPESTVTTMDEPPPEDDTGAGPTDAASPCRSRWRTAAIIAVPVLLVAGLVWQLSRGASDGPATPPTSVPTATSAGSSVPGEASKPPPLRNTGEDFDTIVRSVDAFSNWVYQFDPDPKWVPSYIDPNDTDQYGFAREQKNLADMKAAGRHYDSPASIVRKVILRDRVSENHVTVYVVYEFPPASIIDRDGRVVVTQPSGPLSGQLEEWVRSDDGRWRRAHSVALGPPAPEVLK